MAAWSPCPQAPFDISAAALKKNWKQLHASDLEPWPKDAAVQAAWLLFHRGEFQQAHEAGLAAGAAGVTVANKAQITHARHLERDAAKRQAHLQEAAARALAQQKAEPGNANAWFWYAFALGRYAQDISTAKALTQGIGGKVKAALQKTIELAPEHADAHVGLGSFHAEVIAAVGPLLAKVQGADKATGVKLLRRALQLSPADPGVLLQVGNALVQLEGQARSAEADELCARAADHVARDAFEHLDVLAAKAELGE